MAIRKVTRNEWLGIFASMICGFICHGTIIFNTLIFHDDSVLRFHMLENYTIYNGRWTLELMTIILNRICGTEGLPAVYGFVSLFFLSMVWLILDRLFDFKKKYSKVLLIVFINVLPVIMTNFGYFCSTIFNFFGFLLAVLGVALICKSPNVKHWSFWGGVVVSALAIGEYQCLICTSFTLILLYYMKEIYVGDIQSARDLLKKLCKYIFGLVSALLFYLVVLKIWLYLGGIELSSYAGINTYGIVSFTEYLKRIVLCYKHFIVMDAPWTVFPFKHKIWHGCVLALLAGLCVYSIWRLIANRKKKQAIWMLMIFLLLPMALNSMMLLYEYNNLHGLHTYSYIGLFVWILLLIENNQFQSFFYKCFVVFLSFIGFLYFRYDNLCYFQLEITQERAKDYFCELKTRIQSTEGYNEETKICFLNEKDKIAPETAGTISTSDVIANNPFRGMNIPRNYVWREFMGVWTGYYPEEITELDSVYDSFVEQMPRYPYAGSIQWLENENVIVVKF